MAYMIARRLTEAGDDVRVIDIAKTRRPQISGYERMIIGGSIHVGRIQREIKAYCEKNSEILMTKSLGLYICCMAADKKTRHSEFESSFPDELKQYASAKGIMGGEFLLEKMNFIEKLVVRKIAHAKETVHDIDLNAVEKFLKDLGI